VLQQLLSLHLILVLFLQIILNIRAKQGILGGTNRIFLIDIQFIHDEQNHMY